MSAERHDFLVLVGLIGSGKTAIAQAMGQHGYQVLPFDSLWHNKFQRMAAPENVAIKELIRYIRGVIGEGSVVLDGWWTWDLEWHKRQAGQDESLQLLAEAMEDTHDVRVRYLEQTYREAARAHAAKAEAGLYTGPLSDMMAYRDTIPSRRSYLQAQVSRYREWCERRRLPWVR